MFNLFLRIPQSTIDAMSEDKTNDKLFPHNKEQLGQNLNM